MAHRKGQGPRRPATKLPHLQKKLRQQKVQRSGQRPKSRG